VAADSRRRHRAFGFALLTAVVAIAIIAVLATTMLVTVSGDNDQARIERTADILQRLVAAIDTPRVAGGQSFRSQVNAYPGRLSHLYTPIVGTGRRCNGSYTGGQVNNWRGPYYMVPIATTGHRIAPGFFAEDSMVRISSTDVAIRLNQIALSDAQALQLLVDKKSDGTGPIVTFTIAGDDPVDVRYHIFLTGC
jgi:type II secretory pathway pseudopilin PulG